MHDQDPNRIPTVDDGSHPYTPPSARMAEAEIPRQSAMGKASLALGILAGLLLFGIMGFSIYMAATDPTALMTNNPQAQATLMMVGFAVILSVLFAVAGLGLGIAGVLQSNRRRMAAAFGLAINAMIVLGMVGLWLLGTAMG